MIDEQTTQPEATVPDIIGPEAAADEKLFTDEQFAHLGGGTLAYVKLMISDEINTLFPNAPALDPGLKIFALFGADGRPLLLSDSRAMAVANARENELELMSIQ